MKVAQQLTCAANDLGVPKGEIREQVKAVIANPRAFLKDDVWSELANMLFTAPMPPAFFERDKPAPWKNWGIGLEDESLQQMARASRLPVSVRGALMPDAHVGYGLPIGGVLATENAVIPYAVGVDIACRMRLTVLDMPAAALDAEHTRDRLRKAIEEETRFGIGASFKKPRNHAVMDADWTFARITHQCRDKAWTQLGTSGSGNHFVEFGMLTITPEQVAARSVAPPHSTQAHGSGWSFDLPAGTYLALLSHSGSRGTGAAICDHYSKLAMERHPELPKDLKYLAWLGLDTNLGKEYWEAMNLMGQYAAANHECIHRHVLGNLGAQAIGYVENHHNFAWKETHDPDDGGGERELIVHRKGATPAGENILGMIPGSMAAPGFVVRGRGSTDSLRSASHGAGRVMSRTKARDTFAWGNVKRELVERNVEVMSAGIDEVPGVYKDIHKVMAQQSDLVDIIGRFDPRLVKMAPEGERAED